MPKIKIAIVLGTRPEIIKMSPIIRACQKRSKDVDFFILHSGQHYDDNMDKVFFKDLELPLPRYNLHVGSKPFAEHVALMMKGMKKIFLKEQPDVVVVQGDTITVLMGALAAKKYDIPVAHHEAGLRSHDIRMPEEVNRILTDHVSEFLFCPTKDALKNIKHEGLNADYYSMTGNTIVDAIQQNILIAEKRYDKLADKSNLLTRLGLKPKKYILITVHRAENTDSKKRLTGIIEGICLIKKQFPAFEMIFPIHPRTSKKLNEYKIQIPKEFTIIEPLGFLDFLQLEKSAALCITDSGGLQEECSILHVPVVTVRDNTERPETVAAGMNILAGTDPAMIARSAAKMLCKDIRWKNVFGDGHAGERIVDEIITQIRRRKSLKERMKWARRAVKKNLR